MQFISWLIDNPVKVSVSVLLVVLFGFIGMFSMPLQLTPEVDIPTITVETRWPGASPQEIEREIIQEQEEQLRSVEGVTKMTAESADSLGRILLEFPVGTNMSEALLRVNTKLQQVREYPEDADEPTLSTSDANANAIAWFIFSPRLPTPDEIAQFQTKNPKFKDLLEPIRVCHNPGLAMQRLNRLAAEHPELDPLLPPKIEITHLRNYAEDVIESRLERVPGVSNANVVGGNVEELQVVVDPEKLAARRMTIGDLRRSLREQNHDTSAGDLWEGKRRYVIRTLGQFTSPEQVAGLIVSRRDNAPVYVRDVAEVQLGFAKPTGFVRRYGADCIAVSVQRETGSNVLRVMKGLAAANSELNNGPLKSRGLQLTQVYDETEYIHSAIDLVNSNIVIGGLLTIAVLLAFLRSGRSTLIISLAIPVSIIGTFLIMYWQGRSLNVISLAGLAFATGMLVDNAIVVLENIYRHYQLGASPRTAAVKGTAEVYGAVAASTLTTLAVFVPILFVQQEAGQLFRDIALAIAAAVGLSMIVSITVVPVAAARILKSRPGEIDDLSGGFSADAYAHKARERGNAPAAGVAAATGSPDDLPFEPEAVSPWVQALMAPFDWAGSAFVSGIMAINRLLQGSVLLRMASIAVFVGGSIFFSYVLLPKVEYLPTGNRNLTIGIILPPPGYNLDELARLGSEVEGELRPYWDVDPNSPAAQQLDFPAISDFFFVVRDRMVFVGLRAADPLRAGELVPLVRKATSRLPGTFAIAMQTSLFERGLGAGRTIDVEITGPDLKKLVSLGGQVLMQVMIGNPGKSPPVIPGCQARPVPSLDLSSPEVHLIPKEDQTADMQLSKEELGYLVNALVDGAYATDFYNRGDKIDLKIMGKASFAQRTQDLKTLPIAVPTGELVALESVANVLITSGPEQINRRERQRAITISVSPPPTMALEDAMQRIGDQIVQPLIASGQLEGGLYQINLAGTADKLRATWGALYMNLLFALLITYLLMAALFESYVHPLVIIFSVPLGAVGGVAALWAVNTFYVLQPLDVVTMLGFVILIGTVVNNPILIVHQALNLMREGRPTGEAVLESTRTRIRPIFMTTTTTVFGLIPLVLFPGAGSELYRGLGAVVLGGLVISTLFTLVLVPALFTLAIGIMASASKVWAVVEDGLRAILGMAPAAPAAVRAASTAIHVEPPQKVEI